MVNVSVSQLVNQVDKSHFTLYSEWENTHFKVILLRSSTIPLSGEVCNYPFYCIYFWCEIRVIKLRKTQTNVYVQFVTNKRHFLQKLQSCMFTMYFDNYFHLSDAHRECRFLSKTSGRIL